MEQQLIDAIKELTEAINKNTSNQDDIYQKLLDLNKNLSSINSELEKIRQAKK